VIVALVQLERLVGGTGSVVIAVLLAGGLPKLPGLPKLKLVPRSRYARALVERITRPWQR
jgi:hypothetical protein